MAETARNPVLSARLELNLAEAAELRQLPGIGPVLAGRIIAERERAGPFRSVDELARIPGLGERTLAEARPFLFVSRVTSSSPAVTSSTSERSGTFLGGEGGVTPSLDLNRASSHELQALPGIGPVLADRIVADRSANGPFRHIGDITRVKGIKQKTLEKIRPYLRVEEATTAHDARLGS
jgi:competence ComEA-like helix-hairpin-helix protein